MTGWLLQLRIKQDIPGLSRNTSTHFLRVKKQRKKLDGRPSGEGAMRPFANYTVAGTESAEQDLASRFLGIPRLMGSFRWAGPGAHKDTARFFLFCSCFFFRFLLLFFILLYNINIQMYILQKYSTQNIFEMLTKHLKNVKCVQRK